MIHECPCCGHRFADPDAAPDPVEEMANQFAAICAQNDYVIRAGKVSESVAAKLLGYRKQPFAALRRSGDGPAYYYFSVEGSRYAYTLKELAAYQLAHQNGESWI